MLTDDDLFAGLDILDTKIDIPLAFLGMESFQLSDEPPTNSETPTEVTESGEVEEVQRIASPQVVMARCPISISTTEVDGVTKKIVHAHIRGPIEDMAGYVPLIDTLNRADESFVFVLHIQSGGGMVTTGATISSAMVASKGHVITIAEGLCASAASLIWSSGDECIVTDYAMFMYHMSSHADMNNSVQVADSASKMVNYVKHCLMKNALSKGHITPDQHRTFCENRDDVWISADEMRAHLAGSKIEQGVDHVA